LTNIRSNSQVLAKIPFDSLILARKSNVNKRSTDANGFRVFFATLLSERFSFDIRKNTSQVKYLIKNIIGITIITKDELSLQNTVTIT